MVASTVVAFLARHFGEVALERHRSALANDLERLRSELALTSKRYESALEPRTHIGKIQFEKEFGFYTEVWSSLSSVQKAALSLRPSLDFYDPGEPEADRKQKRLVALETEFTRFHDLFEATRPFYPELVYRALSAVRELVHLEAVTYQHGEPSTREYWKDARENRGKLVEAIDEVCTAIRARLAEIVVSG